MTGAQHYLAISLPISAGLDALTGKVVGIGNRLTRVEERLERH